MIVTNIEALHLRPGAIDADAADGSQDALIVRVHTDEGLVGLGEVDSFPPVIKAAIDGPPSHKIASGLGALLVGEDPFDIGRLWQKLYRGSLYYGRRGPAIHAMSGIDIALWDLLGKATGKPVHALLGGARRTQVRAYASTLMPDTVEEAKAVAATQVEAGFTGLKLGWGGFGRDADRDVALVAAAREGGGGDLELMVDIGCAWTTARTAIDRVRRMEEFRPYWIEEPFMPDDYANYRQLADAVDAPIAGGENEVTVWDFERLVEQGDVDIVQPDVTRAGGISECMRIADLARRTGRRCVLHSWSTGIIKAASLHVLAAMDDAEWLEYCIQETELNQRLVNERFPVRDGFVDVPHKPGLGVELDEELLTASRV